MALAINTKVPLLIEGECVGRQTGSDLKWQLGISWIGWMHPGASSVFVPGIETELRSRGHKFTPACFDGYLLAALLGVTATPPISHPATC